MGTPKRSSTYPLGASDHSASEKKAGWRDSLRERRAAKKKEKEDAKSIKTFQKDINRASSNLANTQLRLHAIKSHPGITKGAIGRYNERHRNSLENDVKKYKSELDNLISESKKRGYALDEETVRQHTQDGLTDLSIERSQYKVRKDDGPVKGVSFKSDRFGNVTANSEEIQKSIKELKKKADEITGLHEEISNQYNKELKALSNDTKFIDDLAKQTLKELGVKSTKELDDPELSELFIYDVVDDSMSKKLSKDLSSKNQKLQKSFDDYHDSISKMTNDIVKEYGDVKISDTKTYKDAVDRSLRTAGGKTDWVNYLWKNQEISYIDSEGYDEIYDKVRQAIKKY